MIHLYKIVNVTNNKIYIGQSVNPARRWDEHMFAARKPKLPLHFAIRKHGVGAFRFEVIAVCRTIDDANELETHLVAQFCSFVGHGRGYNATYGGMNAPKTDEWKQKISAIHSGRDCYWAKRENLPPELRAIKREQMLGNKRAAGAGPNKNSFALGKPSPRKGKASERRGSTWRLVNGKRVWSCYSEGASVS